MKPYLPLCIAGFLLTGCLPSSDDDDSTANDDDSAANDDDSAGDDDDSGSAAACPPAFSSAADALCEAALWGGALVAEDNWNLVQNELVAELDAMAACGCPTSTVVSTGPDQVPIECLGFVTGLATTSDRTWGSCTSGGYLTSGALVDGHSNTECPSAGLYIFNREIVGTGFSSVAQPGCQAGDLLELALNGRVRWLDDTTTTQAQYVGRSNVEATITVGGTLAGTRSQTLFPTGTNVIDLSRGEQTSFPGGVSLLHVVLVQLEAARNTTTAPLTALGEVRWEWTADTGAGCQVEPVSGDIELSVLDAPGGAVLTSAVVSFDGATACDGCAGVTIDGASTGTWCSADWSL